MLFQGILAPEEENIRFCVFFGSMLSPVATFLAWDIQSLILTDLLCLICQASLLPSSGTWSEHPFTSWAPLLALCAQSSLPPATAARNRVFQDGQESPSENNSS